MKLIAELNHEKHEVNFKRNENNIVVEIDGRHYDLEASEVEPNVYLLKHNNQIYQIYVAPNGIVNVANNQLEVKISDPKRLRSSSSSDINTDGIIEIKTAMPGKIVRILVNQGDEILQGDGVIIVEAMKMQNEMKSPKDGIVKSIKVEELATVNAGDVLVVIE